MAILDSAKVDLLYKKLFGVAKTDTATNKSPSNESIASASLNRGDKTWIESGSISAAAPAANTNIIQVYKNQYTVNCSADTTSTAVGGIFPTWKTNLTDWIPPEFGNTYFVQVFSNDRTNAANVAATGLQMFDSGIAGVGEWFFDYQSGVLNFIGGTIPSGLVSANNVYIAGYRYTGLKDVNSSLVLKRGDTMTGSLTLSGEGTNLKFSGGSSLVGNEANNLIKITANNNNDNTGVVVQSGDGGLAQVYSNGRIEIITDTGATGSLWTFGNDGKLTAPGALDVAGNASVNSLTITSNNISVNSATVDGGNF